MTVAPAYTKQLFRIHRLNISVSTNSTWIAHETLRDLKHYLVSSPHHGHAQANLNFHVADRVRSFNIGRNAVRDVFADHIEIFTGGPERYIRLGPTGSSSFVRLHLDRIQVQGRLHRNHERSPMSRALLKWSIIKAFEKKSVIPIHSSGVSSDHRVRLFVGRTGSGKTSILVLFLLNRHRMLADDFLFFQGKTLYPFPIRSTLHPDTMKRLAQKIRKTSLSTKLATPLSDLTRIFETVRHKVDTGAVSIYYIRVWNSTRTKVIPLSPKKMLGFMIDSYLSEFDNSYWFGWRRLEVIRNILEAYSRLAELAECFEVRAGEDPEDRYKKIVMAE